LIFAGNQNVSGLTCPQCKPKSPGFGLRVSPWFPQLQPPPPSLSPTFEGKIGRSIVGRGTKGQVFLFAFIEK